MYLKVSIKILQTELLISVNNIAFKSQAILKTIAKRLQKDVMQECNPV